MPSTVQGHSVGVKERGIYPNLKVWIYTNGIRQNQLAKMVGIDQAHLSRIMNGLRVPTKELREQIAQVLGCDADWLFERTRIIHYGVSPRKEF